jgi:hypothetical protein
MLRAWPRCEALSASLFERMNQRQTSKGDSLSSFWWFLGVAVLIVWIVSVVDIVRRRSTLSKASFYAWVLIVILIPVVGSLLYLVLNRAAGSRVD